MAKCFGIGKAVIRPVQVEINVHCALAIIVHSASEGRNQRLAKDARVQYGIEPGSNSPR